MFKIGEFAKIARVTVRALRYYDEMGLLRPHEIDRWTGYRYYGADQLPRLNRILALKDLGLSLDQIIDLMKHDLSAAELRGMLRMKQAELQQQMSETQAQLQRVEARLIQIERENEMSTYDVVTKRVEPLRAAVARGVVPNMEVIGPTFDRLFDEAGTYVYTHKIGFAGPGIALYYDEGENDTMENMSVGAAMPTNAPPTTGERVSVEELPAVETAACVVHHGPFATISEAYRAVMGWVNDNNYTIVGPTREVYLEYERGGDQTKFVTEIQVPVAPKERA